MTTPPPGPPQGPPPTTEAQHAPEGRVPRRIRASWAALGRAQAPQLLLALVLVVVLGVVGWRTGSGSLRAGALGAGVAMLVTAGAQVRSMRLLRLDLYDDRVDFRTARASGSIRLGDVTGCLHVVRMPGSVAVPSHPACALVDRSGRAALWASGQMIAPDDLAILAAWAARVVPVTRLEQPTRDELAARWPVLFAAPRPASPARSATVWVGAGLVVFALVVMAVRALS